MAEIFFPVAKKKKNYPLTTIYLVNEEMYLVGEKINFPLEMEDETKRVNRKKKFSFFEGIIN